MRKGWKLAAALWVAAMFVPAGVAGANGKERVLVESFTESYAFAVDCGDFGPYAFESEVEGSVRVRVTDVLDRNGALLQTVFHIFLKETDTNSVSGKSLPLRTALHEVWDYASNTRTLSGAVFVGTEPGAGTYVQDTGRITLTLDTREAQFVAGPHEAFFGGGVDPIVCAALAGE
jgi:hypothetical protein